MLNCYRPNSSGLTFHNRFWRFPVLLTIYHYLILQFFSSRSWGHHHFLSLPWRISGWDAPLCVTHACFLASYGFIHSPICPPSLPFVLRTFQLTHLSFSRSSSMDRNLCRNHKVRKDRISLSYSYFSLFLFFLTNPSISHMAKEWQGSHIKLKALNFLT